MSLNEVIEAVQKSPARWVQYSSPVKLYSKDGRSLIVFDREAKDFVRSCNEPLFRKPSEAKRSDEANLLGLEDWIEDRAYQASDLFHIARKYGVGTALKYEGKVIKASFKRLVHQPTYGEGYMNHKAA